MAAYGAAFKLLVTLKKLQSSSDHPQIEELFEAVDSMRCFLAENREVKAEFETQIREAIYEAEDIIDSHMWSAHFLSPSEAQISSQIFHEDLERVKQKINLIAEMTTEEFNHLTLDRKISNSVWINSNDTNYIKGELRLLGRDEDVNKLTNQLMNGPDGLQVVPIVGVAGMGKTFLARCLLNLTEIVNHFDVIGWVKVSIKYKKRDKLLDIIASLRKSIIGIHEEVDDRLEEECTWSDEILQMSEKQLVKHIYNSLKYKRYIILLDDIRDVGSWNDFKELFPDHHKRSRILLTTRDVKVEPASPYKLDRLSNEASFALLKETVFGDEPCAAHLAIIARDIACHCRGLPHALFIVGRILCCAKPIAEYWEMVLSSIISKDNYVDLMEAIVPLTYNHLPQYLKVCLLYMAIFPYDYAIPLLKLLFQWTAEGFIGESESTTCWNLKRILMGESERLCIKKFGLGFLEVIW